MDVDGAFQQASAFILGANVGKLEEYHDYLKGAILGKTVSSMLSGKPLFVTSKQYCEGARFFDCLHESKEADRILSKPIDIDSIKDIDSLLESVAEKALYAGSKVLGNSIQVDNSDNIVNGEHISHGAMILDSRYVAYSYMIRKSEYMFGCTSTGDSSWAIRCFYNNSIQRCFECCTCVSSWDCLFSYNLMASSNCMFSFNLMSKQWMIGNVQLKKEEYLDLKKKLVGEMAEKLQMDKRLPFSIVDLPYEVE